MNKKEVIGLLARYLALIVLALGNLILFYKVFTPLTIYPAYWALSLLYDIKILAGNILFFEGYYAEIIPACIAGAAYYFLLILNLSTPMNPLKRAKSIIFSIFAFWALNITRITIFAAMFFAGFRYLDFTHAFFWYFGSTLIVVLIWFLTIWLFKITCIPIYTDFKNIFGDIKGRENDRDL